MRILVGVDGSRASRAACEFVGSRTWPAGTRVRLLAAVEPIVDWTGLAPPRAHPIEIERDTLRVALDDRADELRRHGLAVETVVEVGRAEDLLIAHAAETFSDLIVVGSRGLGPAASALLGSVSAHLVDHSECPVLVARSPTASRMLLATDGTESSRSIPRVLVAWGNAFKGLPVEVLSVAPRERFVTPWAFSEDEEAEARRDPELVLHAAAASMVADEMTELGWRAGAVARCGDPGREIVATGNEAGADLIVTGSRGIGTLHRLVGGSVAHDVLMHARSSVLVVRGHVPAHIRDAVAARPAFA